MGGGSPLSYISDVVKIVGAIKGMSSKPPSPPTPQAPPVPSGPATQPDVSSFSHPSASNAPAFLQLGPGLSDVQQRTAIASSGVNSQEGKYKDPASLDYYKNLAFRTLTDDSGKATGSPTGADYQFLQQAFGQTPHAQTTESFLSALMRG